MLLIPRAELSWIVFLAAHAKATRSVLVLLSRSLLHLLAHTASFNSNETASYCTCSAAMSFILLLLLLLRLQQQRSFGRSMSACPRLRCVAARRVASCRVCCKRDNQKATVRQRHVAHRFYSRNRAAQLTHTRGNSVCVTVNTKCWYLNDCLPTSGWWWWRSLVKGVQRQEHTQLVASVPLLLCLVVHIRWSLSALLFSMLLRSFRISNFLSL